MYMLQISLETVTINEIVTSWRLMATIQGAWRSSFPSQEYHLGSVKILLKIPVVVVACWDPEQEEAIFLPTKKKKRSFKNSIWPEVVFLVNARDKHLRRLKCGFNLDFRSDLDGSSTVETFPRKMPVLQRTVIKMSSFWALTQNQRSAADSLYNLLL